MAVSEFSATLRLTGDRAAPVAASIAVESGRIVVNVGDVEVGSWPVSRVIANPGRTGVDLTVDGDSFSLDLTDADDLLESIRVARSPHPPSRRLARRRARLPENDRPPRRKVPMVVYLGLVATAGVAVASLLWPLVTGPVGLLIGLVLVTVGYFAHTEPSVALRIPHGLSASFILITGVGVLVIGMGVTLLG